MLQARKPNEARPETDDHGGAGVIQLLTTSAPAWPGHGRAATAPPGAGRTEGLVRLFGLLADPTRLRIVDTLRKAAPEAVCQCELLPLFDMSQPALAKHLKQLVASGVIGAERRGLWAYYFIPDDSRMGELSAWLR